MFFKNKIENNKIAGMETFEMCRRTCVSCRVYTYDKDFISGFISLMLLKSILKIIDTVEAYFVNILCSLISRFTYTRKAPSKLNTPGGVRFWVVPDWLKKKNLYSRWLERQHRQPRLCVSRLN